MNAFWLVLTTSKACLKVKTVLRLGIELGLGRVSVRGLVGLVRVSLVCLRNNDRSTRTYVCVCGFRLLVRRDKIWLSRQQSHIWREEPRMQLFLFQSVFCRRMSFWPQQHLAVRDVGKITELIKRSCQNERLKQTWWKAVVSPQPRVWAVRGSQECTKSAEKDLTTAGLYSKVLMISKWFF